MRPTFRVLSKCIPLKPSSTSHSPTAPNLPQRQLAQLPQLPPPDKLLVHLYRIQTRFPSRAYSSRTPSEEEGYAVRDNPLSQKSRNGQEQQPGSQIDDAIGQQTELQARTPWHREGPDMPPVKRMRSASAMTMGKLLTTPSRLLKLIIPLTTLDKNSDRKSIEPLALLVHPQQPLSYLERLIQSELPMIKGQDGKEVTPRVYFRAEDSVQNEIRRDPREDTDPEQHGEGSSGNAVDENVTGAGNSQSPSSSPAAACDGGASGRTQGIESDLRGGPGEGGVEVYSGEGRENSSRDRETRKTKFVRWSTSTEIGDFIRDAARGKEFAIEIEGASKEIRVGVPSFNDRTHYLRVRLRKTSKQIATLASVKKECDELAHRSAQRLAMGGFGVLLAWWGAIYHFTFQTDYGWDTMEPITYLAGLSIIMMSYLWFLWHNREVSYRAALNLTVSRRQNKLYQDRGFDIQKWEALIEEANALRKDIKNVADEYDVDWDERSDEKTEAVHDVLKEEREKAKKRDDDDDDDSTDGEDEGKKVERRKRKEPRRE